MQSLVGQMPFKKSDNPLFINSLADSFEADQEPQKN